LTRHRATAAIDAAWAHALERCHTGHVLAALDAADGRRTRLNPLGELLLGDAQLDAAADDLTLLGEAPACR
jgi:hypothetical protein